MTKGKGGQACRGMQRNSPPGSSRRLQNALQPFYPDGQDWADVAGESVCANKTRCLTGLCVGFWQIVTWAIRIWALGGRDSNFVMIGLPSYPPDMPYCCQPCPRRAKFTNNRNFSGK